MPKAKAPIRQFKSEAHRTAHDALVSMKVPSEEAHQLVHAQPEPDPNLSHDDAVSQLLFGALRQRASGQKRVQMPAGGPQGAVPLHPAGGAQTGVPTHPPPKPTGAPPEAPAKAATGGPASVPTGRAPIAPAPIGGARPTFDTGVYSRLAKELHGSPEPTTPPLEAATPPVGPAQAQIEKPRIRMRLARGMPVAPIGAPPPAEPSAAPTQPQPQQELPPAGPAAAQTQQKPPGAEGGTPEIADEEQYNRLAPGTLFRWMAPGPFQGRLFRAHVKGQPQT
jgi:hypothetical protein